MDLSNDKLRLVDSFATSDPNVPRLDPEYHRGWFARQAAIGKAVFYRAPKAELDHILQQWLEYFYVTAENEAQYARERQQIETVIWPWLELRLLHNKGLVKFMREYGVYSRYFVPLLRTVPGAWALCVAHGECPDIFGKIQKIPRADKIYQFVERDEMFAFARLRKTEAMTHLEQTQHGMILGAGTLQEVRSLQRFQAERSHGPHAQPWLVACDSDQSLQEYFAQVLDCPLANYGVDYRYVDFREEFADPQNWEAFDYVAALGVASYYDLESFLGYLKQIMRPGAVVTFDLQVHDGGPKWKKPYWQHTLTFDYAILRWVSDMKPQPSIAVAIENVEAACATLELEVDHYTYDPNNPIGIVFQCSCL